METENFDSEVQVLPAVPKPPVKKKSKSKPQTKKAKPKTEKKTIPKQPVKKKLSTVFNSCRMDIRLPFAEREKLMRKAKAMRRTMTSIMVELIEKMK